MFWRRLGPLRAKRAALDAWVQAVNSKGWLRYQVR